MSAGIPGRVLAAIDLDDVGVETLRVAHARTVPGGHLGVCHTLHERLADPAARTAALDEAREHIKTRLRAELGETARTVEVFVGDGEPAAEIATCADGWCAELIVIGRPSAPAGALRRALSPGVVDRVVHGAPCSVLVCRSANGTGGILAAVEADETATYDVLSAATAEQRRRPGVLHVVHCIARVPVIAPTVEGVALPVLAWDDLAAASRQQIADTMTRIGAIGDIQVVPRDPQDGLIETARELAVDLIVVGTHDRNRLSRLILGSVSDQMTNAAPCSVLVVRLEPGAR